MTKQLQKIQEPLRTKKLTIFEVTLFLLIHDVHNGSEAKAQEVLANLKQTFGESTAFMLRMNSNGEKGPDPWKGFIQRLHPGMTV